MEKRNKPTEDKVSGGRPPSAAPGFASRLGPLLFLTAIFCLNFISRIVLAPLMPAIEADLGLGHAEAGSLFLVLSLGYFVSLMGSGFVSSRLTHRRTIVLSVAAVGLALLGTCFSGSLWTVRLGLLLLGMAAGLYLPSGMATLSELVPARHWGKAVAVHELAPNVSFIAAPLIAEAFLESISWRGVLAVFGVVCLLLALAFARFGKGGGFRGDTPTFSAMKTLFGKRDFWIIMVLFCLGISGTLGLYAMLPLYLVSERGIGRSWANTLVALSRITSLGMAFVAGWLSDRFGPRWTLMTVLLLTGATTLILGVGPTPWVIAMLFFQPLAAVCFFPPGFAALSSVGPPALRGMAVSVTVPVAFMLGAGALPAGIGLTGDLGSFGWGIGLAGILIMAGSILTFFLRLDAD
ncbi:MAG: MFS transporter [Deltaproteobacteria bacterium]|nr:MFS transporter [Deltaproteobacteria bacterium]